MEKPVVYEYLEYLAFLKAWYQWKKTNHRSFNHRQFSRQTNLSLGYLTNILNGERVPEGEFLDRLITGMGMAEEEGDFFKLLVRLHQAGTWKVRTEILNQIFQNPLFQEVDNIPNQRMEYAARWYYVAIRELADLPDYQPDPEWIQQRLRFPVPLEEIQNTLELLQRLRLSHEVASQRLQTTATVQHEAAFAYHRNMLGLATQSLESIHSTQRAHLGATLSVPTSLIPQLQQEIFKFLHDMSNLCAHAPVQPTDTTNIYQLQVQLFPLTKS